MNKSKLKIGVATHSFGFNYGGTLQCFALLKTLNEGGYDAEFIDYCAVGGRVRAPAHIKFAHRLASAVVPAAKAYSRRMGIFERFGEANCPKMPRFQTYSQVRDYAKAYDVCVGGSDQVWTPVFLGFSPFYMLKFVPPHRRVAYAASFGAAKLSDGYPWVYEKRLGEFLAISTREASGAAIIESLGLPRCVHVMCLFLVIITDYLITISDSPDRVRRLLGASIGHTGVLGRRYCSSFWIVYLPREVPALTFY